jgi:hypothetical protein
VAGRRKSLGEFAVDAYAMASGLPEATTAATSKAALEVTNQARDDIRRDSGGDMVLSGMGAKVGARFEVLKGGDHSAAIVRATGPMQIIESNTKPHSIVAGVGRRTRRRTGAKALLTPFGPRASAQHPGTTGKKTWSKSISASVKDVPKVYQAALAKHLRRYFG